MMIHFQNKVIVDTGRAFTVEDFISYMHTFLSDPGVSGPQVSLGLGSDLRVLMSLSDSKRVCRLN